MLKILNIIIFSLSIICYKFSVASNETKNCGINLAQIQNECYVKCDKILKGIIKIFLI